MPKAIIFDIDGTLIDSVDAHARAWQEALHDFGHDLAFKDVRRQIGKGGDQLMPVFLSPDEIDEKGKDLEAHRSSIFKTRYLSTIRAFPQIRELFQRLRDDGISVALASSAKKDEMQIYKKIAGIEGMVDAETSSEDAEKSKPHADIFDATVARLSGIKPNYIIVVGDTPYDIEAARKAHLHSVGVLSGGFPEASLRQDGCVGVYLNAADLLSNYLTSPLRRHAPALPNI